MLYVTSQERYNVDSEKVRLREAKIPLDYINLTHMD